MRLVISPKSFAITGAVGMIGFVILSALSSGAEDQSDTSGAQSPLVVETLRASALNQYQVTRRFVGRVEARRQSDIGFELPGLIELVSVEEGGRVGKGDSIAKLNTELLEARREELISVRDQAKAQLALSTNTRVRVREANTLDAVSTQVLDEAESGFASAQAALNAAESAIKTINVQIKRSEIVAPFDGIVSRRLLDEGRVVNPGEPVVRLLELANPQVRLAVASRSADQLQPGKEYSLVVNGTETTGLLKTLLPERQNQTRGIEALFDLNEELFQFRSGDLAQIALSENVEARSFRLPITALTESARGIWAVYVAAAGESGFILDRRQIEILHLEGDDVIVRGTLSAGDEVVTGGLHRLTPGQKVRPISSGHRAGISGGSL